MHAFMPIFLYLQVQCLVLVVSTNLFETYFFWELVGVCSYFLIGFWWYKASAAEAAFKAFFMNRIGDCGFLIGILMLLASYKRFLGRAYNACLCSVLMGLIWVA